MSTNELVFLIVAVGAFSLFGGILGWACWMESREQKRL